MQVRVKICCISSLEELHLAVRYGASAVGLVSRMPSGPGVIPDERIAEIAAAVPPGISSFLLTSSQSVREIIDQQRILRTNTIQLCDTLTDGTHQDLKAALPGISLVQVIHVVGPESIAEAQAIAPHVHAILLDSGNPALSTKELGGTGRRHDWAISRRIVEAVPIPVFLAGGLRADNTADAIRTVNPFALDVCSGVRTHGSLDEAKLSAFFDAIWSATG
jgi:phosphoribosylanthranilate isomerase